MRTTVLGIVLAVVSLAAVAQQPIPDVDNTRSLDVATFKAEDGGFTANEITGGRNLSLYDNAGHFDCRRVTQEALQKPKDEKARIASALRKARAFIWEHWQSKKRGYVRITFNSVDATSTSHIFIEPDSKGVWQVTWRIVRHNNEVNDLPPLRTIERKNVGGEPILIFNTADGAEKERL